MNSLRGFIFPASAVGICVVAALLIRTGNTSGELSFNHPNQKELTSEQNSLQEGAQADNTLNWAAPSFNDIPNTPEGSLILYGRELVAHTSVYLGPKGKVAQISNGMNCQNCHLEAGTKPFGNNYAMVASKYPLYRDRSGTVESVEKRVNDCIERSLNGQKLDTASKEMQAFVAYLKWVGKDVNKGQSPEGAGIPALSYLSREANPEKGAIAYQAYCARCHGTNGEGVKSDDGIEWAYPPLYGSESYNIGAGILRLSRFAGFIKANMPYGISYQTPFLTDEEAWDIAAFVNSMPRPDMNISKDWPDISTKPVDHPFGPYADGFSEKQHKFGPFEPIMNARKRTMAKN